MGLDGYCETLEVASYTTDDSSCLAMGDINASPTPSAIHRAFMVRHYLG